MLAACGPSYPTPEEITRGNLVELRAQAVAKHFLPCIEALDRGIAALDAGGTIHDPGWHEIIVATHTACDVPLGRR